MRRGIVLVAKLRCQQTGRAWLGKPADESIQYQGVEGSGSADMMGTLMKVCTDTAGGAGTDAQLSKVRYALYWLEASPAQDSCSLYVYRQHHSLFPSITVM